MLYPSDDSMSNNRSQYSQKQVELSNKLKLYDQVQFKLIQNSHYLPFPDNYFDKIIFFESLCHILDKSH